MKIEVNIEKKYAYGILALLLVLVSVVAINAAVDKTKAYHDSNAVEVTIGSDTKSLQEAINNKDFNDTRIGMLIGGRWCSSDGTKINCTNSVPLTTIPSGTLVGVCKEFIYDNRHTCNLMVGPAYCSNSYCYCPTGYTNVFLGGSGRDLNDPAFFSCAKN